MKLKITTHIIGNDENDKRSLVAGGKVETASALGDLKAEVMEGKHKGRVINAFAWFCNGDDSAAINITEVCTGYCLERIQAIAMVNGKPCNAGSLPNEALWDLVPSFMEAAKKAAFYRFERASDEEADALFKRIDELPNIDANAAKIA